jgi:16S rRNA (guanine966-N2)-methyltransferase
MNIRIISGQYGGRKIEAPDGDRTHPMSERVRNAMFNSIGSEVQGAKVLDVFAGTGSVGLEALSRGAHDATFIELDAQDRTVIVRGAVAAWVDTHEDARFDMIFADPPYGDTQFSTVSKLFGLLKPGGLMLLSHPGRGEIPTKTGVVVVDNRSYGNAYLTSYRREDA